MSQARKEVTKKDAAQKAANAKTAKACYDGIMEEVVKLYRGEQHSIQQLLAYAGQLEKLGKLPSKDGEKKE